MNIKNLIKNIERIITFMAVLCWAGCNYQNNNTEINSDRIDTPTSLSSNDSKFILDAAEISLEGIDLGKLARINANSPVIKNLGEQLVHDYRKVLNQLKDIAMHKTLSLPDEMNSTGRDTYERLMIKRGKEFDELFPGILISVDEDAINMLGKEAKNVQNIEIKEWAASSLAILKNNLTNTKICVDSLHKRVIQ